MLSEFQKRKLSLAFYKFDASQDGVVKKGDFELYGQKVAAYLGLDASSDKYNQTVERSKYIWDAYFSAADRNGNGEVTVEEYLKATGLFLSSDGASDQSVAANMKLFGAIDTDGSGQIQISEFKAFVVPMGVSESAAELAFSKLDRDGSGQITSAEFAKNLADYYISNDPDAVGNWFYGGY